MELTYNIKSINADIRGSMFRHRTLLVSSSLDVCFSFFYSKFMARLTESAVNGQSDTPLIKRSVDSVSSKLNPSLVSLDTNQQEAD